MNVWLTRGHEFADWHHPHCRVEYCERAYCSDHHRLYWICQDFVHERAVNYFGGPGECLRCHLQESYKKMGLPPHAA